jgi:crotonobetainyl-CoA:carnitine CoA-transferase CaiB-like acyl-CoA transferase
MTLPLSGLLVVSLEQAVAAPMCTTRLADAGARVLKIERPEGDFARGYDTLVHGECSYFVWLNRGKESVVLDLTVAADRTLFLAMLKHADIFVQNLKPGAIDKLGFPIAELRREFPRLICCSISGFGETGPYAARKAYDLLIQAESGLASITGTNEPARVGVSVVDITTGMNAYQSILEALIGRARTGEGAALSVSMFDAMADWMAVPLMQQEGGKPPQRIGLAHTSIAPYGAFKSRDGVDILISIQNDRAGQGGSRRSGVGRRSGLRHQCRAAETTPGDRRKSRRQICHARCGATLAKTCCRRYRFRSRQHAGRACAPSASAPYHGRYAERAGLLSGTRGTVCFDVAALRSRTRPRRAHRESAGRVYVLAVCHCRGSLPAISIPRVRF